MENTGSPLALIWVCLLWVIIKRAITVTVKAEDKAVEKKKGGREEIGLVFL